MSACGEDLADTCQLVGGFATSSSLCCPALLSLPFSSLALWQGPHLNDNVAHILGLSGSCPSMAAGSAPLLERSHLYPSLLALVALGSRKKTTMDATDLAGPPTSPTPIFSLLAGDTNSSL